ITCKADKDGVVTRSVHGGASVIVKVEAPGHADFQRGYLFSELKGANFAVEIRLNRYLTFAPPVAQATVDSQTAQADREGRIELKPGKSSYRITARAPSEGYQDVDRTFARDELERLDYIIRFEKIPVGRIRTLKGSKGDILA